MAKCKQCGKNGLFLKLKNGYCAECISNAEKIAKRLEASNQKWLSDPFNKFVTEHGEEAKKFELSIIENRKKLKAKLSLDEKVLLHKENIKIYDELKDFCLSHGEGGKIFFEKRFEHLHNSKCSDLSFIQKDIDALNSLILDTQI